MKLNGFVGKGTGKLGSSVFAVSGGEQIVRQYNPNVSNPSTDAQVEQRAKLKLMSQLAAAFASVIAIPKKGLISARNQFISKNIGLATFANDQASFPLEQLQLTLGAAVLPTLFWERGNNGVINVRLQSNYGAFADKVVWVFAEWAEGDIIRVLSSGIADAGANGLFEAILSGSDNSGFIYAYAVKFASTSEKAKFENYVYEAESPNAVLGIVQRMTTSGNTFSATSGKPVTGL